ncbi:insulinase family protein [Silvimonas sp.]|uniref:M16 family metallopeptidase n=1 Tax=Silvimonas sp. TaxID=2650811 RepID=UPI00283FAB68|nr:insulinase family protein [Silvimonas sp.]MDR3429290.1 insulinase family protein [Silvimonas sp.]
MMKWTRQRLLAMGLAWPLLCNAASPQISADVVHGQLPNGLRYLIVHNANPLGKVDARLLVNAGSLDEMDDEQGIAHLVEHMAFRRTTHFGAGEIVQFLNSAGMHAIADSNAWTGFENTRYWLTLPATGPVFERGLQLMADRVNGVVFDPQELATERDVVLDEYRRTKWLSDELRGRADAFVPDGSYSRRMALGNDSVVAHLPAERITSFYQRNYQPQRMTLLLAGDLNTKVAQARVIQLFSAAPKGDLPATHAAPLVAAGVRAFSSAKLDWIKEPNMIWSWGLPAARTEDLAAYWQTALLGEVITQRMRQRAELATAAPKSADWRLGCGDVAGSVLQLDLAVQAKGYRLQEAGTDLYAELIHLQREGMLQSELNAADERLAGTLRGVSQRGFTNAQWTSRMADYTRCGRPLRSAAEDLLDLNGVIAQTQPQDIQRRAAELVQAPALVAQFLLPPATPKDQLGYYDNNSAREMMTAAKAEPVRARAIATTNGSYIPVINAPGKVVQETAEPGTHGLIWRLSNGIQVLVIPRLASNEQIGVAAIADGGLLSLTPGRQIDGLLLADAMNRSGAGTMNFNDLQQVAGGNNVSLQAWVSVDQQGAVGQAPPQEVELLLQLLHQGFATPRIEDQARDWAVSQARQNWNTNGLDALYQGMKAQGFGPGWPYNPRWTDADFDSVSQSRLLAVRRQLFTNAARFHFVFTGVASPADLQPLVARYLGSLPVQNSAETASTMLTAKLLPTTNIAANWGGEAGTEMHAWAPLPTDSSNAFLAEEVTGLLQRRLTTSLRQFGGKSYGVFGWQEYFPRTGLLIGIRYSTAANQCQQAMALTRKELTRLREQPLSEEELTQIRDSLQAGINNRPQVPEAYARSMAWHWVNGSLADATPDPQRLITADRIQRVAQDWFAPERWSLGSVGCNPGF